MKIHFLFALLCCTLTTSGCTTGDLATKYRPWGMFGGYRDQLVASNHWIVTAGTNGVAADGSVQRIALYRAAELAKAAGFNHIQIINQRGEQTLFGVNGESPTRRSGGSMMIEVIGTNSAAPPTRCLAGSSDQCFTLDVQKTIDEIRPLLNFG